MPPGLPGLPRRFAPRKDDNLPATSLKLCLKQLECGGQITDG